MSVRPSNAPPAAARLLWSVACGLAVVCCAACGASDKPKAPAASAGAKQEPLGKDAPATQRMLGTWRMNLDEVPDTALTEDLRKAKKHGMGDKVRIEYTITEREFVVHKSGAGGREQQRWFYEVLMEDGDALMLERTDVAGNKQQIPASVSGDTLRIGTGNGIVPLKRVK